jgi:large subunit ribosomal protein L5
MAALKDKYQTEIAPSLRERLQLRNVMQVPRLAKIVINMGFDSGLDRDTMQALAADLSRLAGQAAVLTRARLSISNFKLRQGVPIGAKVTLRGARMYEFLQRLVDAALPRIRDFRGLSPRSFDGHGNYTFGIQDQTIFPELDPDDVKHTQGMDITLVTTADSDDSARELLAAFGMPFATAETAT